MSILLVAAACLVSNSELQCQEPKSGVPELEGKFLGVGFKTDGAFAYLEKCQVRRLGQQSFLVGTQADVGFTANYEKWCVGQTIWISISDITFIQVFPTVEAMKARKTALDKDAAAEKDAKTKPK